MASVISSGTTSGTALNMTADTTGVLQLATGATPTTAVTIDTSQNVGIGTTSPGAKLDVNGAIKQATSTWQMFGTDQTFYSDSGYGLILKAPATSNFIAFRSSNDTERMRIDSSGNVGIGTTSPSAALDVRTGTNPTILAKTTGTGFAAVNIDSSSTATQGYLFFNVNGTEVARLTGNASNYLAISTGSTATERMRIDSSGNVNIGAASPSSSTPGTSYFAGSNAYWNNFVPSTVARNQFTFNNPNGEVGRVVTTGSSTSYNTSSDYRLKENVVPMTGALDKVLQLKPVSWTWKSDGLDGQGFIAHELAEVIPDAVSGDKDAVDAEGKPIYQGVDTSFLVATLTAAIKEQQTIINDLKARIETLEAK